MSTRERSLEVRSREALEELTQLAEFRSEPRTLSEIGKRLGLSRERIRQIEARALAKLRVACARRNISVEDLQEYFAISTQRGGRQLGDATGQADGTTKRSKPKGPVERGTCTCGKLLGVRNTSGRCKACHAQWMGRRRWGAP